MYFFKLQIHQNSFSAGAPPRTPAGGAYDAPPDRLVGWGGGHPLPIPFPLRRLRRLDLGAFGASVVRPPPTQIPGYAYDPRTRKVISKSDTKCVLIALIFPAVVGSYAGRNRYDITR